jgi:hypothetical protein
MLTQVSETKEDRGYAETVYQLLSGVEEPVVAVARARAAWNGTDAGFRSVLRAAGAFARDNDGYFFRYWKRNVSEESEQLPQATHLLVFPVPVESRMQVAYSYAQGLFLKHLYSEHGAIPREVRQGWAELISIGGLPDTDELWAGFLKSGVAEDSIEVSAMGWTSGSNIGKRVVEDAFLSESYLLGLARAIAARPSNFQWQAGDQIPAFRKEDFKGEFEALANREALMTSNDPEAEEFRKQNRDKEWNTLQVYGWLEERSREIPEFGELVEQTLAAISEGKGREVSLVPATQRLEEAFREKFVARSSRPDWTGLAVPKITQYLLLWALVDRLPEGEAGRVLLLGWDLSYLHGLKDSFDTPELRGSLKFMKKNKPGRGSKPLTRLTGFEKIETDIRSVPEGAGPSVSAPFEMWDLAEPQANGAGLESGGKVCTVCGKGGDLSETGILPESKKRHYDNPQANKPADVCVRCVQVWSLSPITTADEGYAVVEVPVESFLELFALYESLEGMNRLETLKTLNRVASLSVFPNKYLLLSRSSGKGKMPQVVQYYLQLSRQPHFVESLDGSLEVLAAQDRAELAPEVTLTLSVLRQLPPHYVTSNDEKVPAMSIINALERGRPYEALYVAAFRAHGADRGEMQAITGGVAAYDEEVEGFSEFFAGRQKGAVLQKEIFRDVREFSDYLYKILWPIVRAEVNETRSSVSGVARKYTGNITKSFIRGNTADFLYRIASFVEGRERQNPEKDSWIKWSTRKKIHGEGSPDTEPEEGGAKLKLEQELERYYERYSGNERDWKTFLEEVEARTLALLLLNVQNQRGKG